MITLLLIVMFSAMSGATVTLMAVEHRDHWDEIEFLKQELMD